MLKLHRAAWVMTAVVIAVGLIGTGAWAATSEPKIGVVDLQKVYNDAGRIKQYKEELDSFKQTLTSKLDIRAQNMMLDENEIKELIDLKMKAKPLDADTARIKVLTDTERSKDEELKKLQETKTPNDQEKARLQELMNLQQKSKDTGTALIKDYDGQYQSKTAELQAKIDTDIQAAVNKVAEAKGLGMVLDKASVMVGGIDVTDDVVGRLERK